MASKSKDLDEYPPVQGSVRATTYICGFYVQEMMDKDNKVYCEVDFIVESDIKISLLIAK